MLKLCRHNLPTPTVEGRVILMLAAANFHPVITCMQAHCVEINHLITRHNYSM